MISLLLMKEGSNGGEYLKNAYKKPMIMKKIRRGVLFLETLRFAVGFFISIITDKEKKIMHVVRGKNWKV